MAGTLYLGTSGFSYDEWKHGVFYPEGLKNREMLSYYASRFPSVEINYTFRRFPTEKSMKTWKDETPEGFRFTLKANQRITHWKRLADVDQDVRDFLDRARLLGDRLGTILYQCPPTLHYDPSLIASFVGLAAAVVLIRPWGSAAWTKALQAFVVWTIAVWVVRIPTMALGDHDVAFVVVHGVLAVVSVVLAVLAWRATLPVRHGTARHHDRREVESA